MTSINVPAPGKTRPLVRVCRALLCAAIVLTPLSASAQTCPFDDSSSSLAREGLVLTRHALGMTGAALVNGTDFTLTDAGTIATTIDCPSCGLDINGNGNFDTVDATIISRKIAGYSGAALTNGLALGSGTRNTPAAVQSFLLAGCGQAAATKLKPRVLKRNVDVVNTGQYSSTTIGSDGFPIIAYHDQGAGHLKVAHCDDIECSTSTITTLDATGNVGKFPSITVGPDGMAAISYYDQTNGALKLAVCANVACSTAALMTVDNNNNVGQYSSIAIGEFGKLAISYYDATSFDLKLAVCQNFPTCTAGGLGFNFFTVDSAGDVGAWSAIVYGNTTGSGFSSRLTIAYFDNTNNTVKLAFCSGSTCTAPAFAVVESLGTDSADGISLVLGDNNAPVLSYYKRSSATSALARIAICDGPNCAAPLLRTGGSSGYREQLSSITIGSNGFPVAAFGAATADCSTGGSGTIHRVVRCHDATCASLSASFPSFALGQSPSMTIGVDGNPFFSLEACGSSGSRLSVMHCGDASCSDGYRRR